MSEDNQNFNDYIDPEVSVGCGGHLECFPVEIYDGGLLYTSQGPGIATQQCQAYYKKPESMQSFSFTDLKKMGVVLKRALYFNHPDGRMMYNTKLDESYITRHPIYNERPNTMLFS